MLSIRRTDSDDSSDSSDTDFRSNSAGWPRALRVNWQSVRSMMTTAYHLLNAEWTDLDLRSRYQRLRIKLKLRLGIIAWKDLCISEKKAAVDHQFYHGHELQIQAVCPARTRLVCQPCIFEHVGDYEACGRGFPGQLWATSTQLC